LIVAYFENEFRPFVNPCPTVVIDFNVMLHPILDWAEKNVFLKFESEVEEKLIKAAWAARINRGPEMLKYNPNYRFLVIADNKFKATGNYWRDLYKKREVESCWEEYCEEKNLDISETPTAYKGTRGEKTLNFYRVFDIGKEYCEKYYNFFDHPGFEADDFAGAIYRISRDEEDSVAHKRQILLLTIDRDWSQLVSDEHRIYFANTRKPFPNEKIQERLCGNKGVIEHTKHRMKFDLDHPKNLAFWKVQHGDMGDNLPPGSPIELFDLTEANPEYNVDSLPQVKRIREELNNPKPNSQPDHYRQSLSAFIRCLVEAPIEL
jgi:hypothetical protein